MRPAQGGPHNGNSQAAKVAAKYAKANAIASGPKYQRGMWFLLVKRSMPKGRRRLREFAYETPAP